MNAPLSKTLLGDLLAEKDSKMLDVAFFETPEYKSLTVAFDHTTVVGRRGTGKTALFYRLAKFWTANEKLILLKLAPEEIEILGLRPYADPLGARLNLIRAYYRLVWRFALSMEIATQISQLYKYANLPAASPLTEAVRTWKSSGATPSHRLRSHLKTIPRSTDNLDGQIADLAAKLQLTDLEAALKWSLADTQQPFFILIDDLDEGYEPDQVGISLVCGILHAAIDVQARFPNIKTLVFLRDNIFRAVARLDPDYERTIEGRVIRLHWDEFNLFSMICNRLRVAFKLTNEEDLKVWNKCTARNLQGKDGFRQCLQLTLYRPRDLISLLNNAFYRALSQSRSVIVDEDIEQTAKEISQTRLDGLLKEYKYVFPALEPLVNCFANTSPERSYAEACALIQAVLSADKHTPLQQQDLAIFKTPEQATRGLYSVGFLGLQRPSGASFVFCHDGNSPTLEFTKDTKLLIHPCYWMALNLTRNILQPDEAAEINDDYNTRPTAMEVISQTPAIRRQTILHLIESLNEIPCGDSGAYKFQEWCLEALKIVFAGALRNIQVNPNKDATQRRDIVGTNLGETATWKRVLQQYSSSQVTFEVKNYADDIGVDEFRQMNSYLALEYGNCGFIITRAPQDDLRNGRELNWVREFYSTHHKLIVKLTANWLITQLNRLNDPVKHNAPDEVLGRLLDRYIRVYLSHGASPGNKVPDA